MVWALKKGGYRYPSEERWVFRGLDLEIQAKELIRVVGRNGSGKSTLLRVLGGEETLTEGALDRDQHGTAVYLDQFAGQLLANDLTLRDHLMLAGACSVGAFPKALLSLSQYNLGLEKRLDEFVGHLSGGQKQIVALTCVLLSNAQLICLDEFTAALDMRARAHALLTVLAQAKDSAAVVFVSHDNSTKLPAREINLEQHVNSMGAIG